jgi:hypothetical protein
VIDGTVSDINGRNLSGWEIQVIGESGSSSAFSDANGHYAVSGLAPGNYTICILEQPGFVTQMPQSSAPCPSGVGYTFMVAENEVLEFVDFVMSPQ